MCHLQESLTSLLTDHSYHLANHLMTFITGIILFITD